MAEDGCLQLLEYSRTVHWATSILTLVNMSSGSLHQVHPDDDIQVISSIGGLSNEINSQVKMILQANGALPQ